MARGLPTGPVPDVLKVERVGLGYVGSLMPAGVIMGVDRIFSSRGEMLGELTVERAPEGHVFIGRFNLSSVAARKQTAQYLGGRTNNVDWEGTLEELCLAVIVAEREGAAFDTVGTDPPLERLDWLLEPLLVRGEPTIVFGAGDAGKSLLSAAAAVMVTTGQMIVNGFRPDSRGARVLVVDYEDQKQQWNDRIAALAKAAGLEPPSIIYRRGMGVPLTEQIHDLAQQIAQQSVGLLIVDSVGLAIGGRGDGAGAEESALKMFAALRHLSVTTLLIDHVGGSDLGSEKLAVKPYGSVYKAWMARSVWQLRAGSTTPDGVLHAGLWHQKFNAGPKHAPIGIGVHFGPGEITIHREDIDDEDLTAALPLQGRIYTALLAGGKSARQLSEFLDEPPNKVRTYLARMLERGLVIQLEGRGRDRPWGAVAGREQEAARDARGSAPEPATQQFAQQFAQQLRIVAEEDPWN